MTRSTIAIGKGRFPKPLSRCVSFSLCLWLFLAATVDAWQQQCPSLHGRGRMRSFSISTKPKAKAKPNALHYCLPPSSLSFRPDRTRGFWRRTEPREHSTSWLGRTMTMTNNNIDNNNNINIDNNININNNRKTKDNPAQRLLRKLKVRSPLLPLLIATTLVLFLFLFPTGALALTEGAPVAATAATATTAATAATAAAGRTVSVTTKLVCPVSAEVERMLTLRLVYAALMGAALGKERSFAKHSAGVRTMSLVSMGAAIFTVCSCYGFSGFARVDASRMAASVASGVGFVGAGVITTSMQNPNNKNRGDPSTNPQPNNVVHGLTTAATIWLSAAVGVSCGVGLLRVATTAAAATIFILRMGRKRHQTPADENGNERDRERKRKRKSEQQSTQQQQQQQQQQGEPNHGTNQLVVTNHSSNSSNIKIEIKNKNKTKNGCGQDSADAEENYNPAEIHVTNHWDENEPERERQESPRGGDVPLFNEEESSNTVRTAASSHTEPEIHQDNAATRENSNSNDNDGFWTGDVLSTNDPSYQLMEEIVRSAWSNNNSTVTALVDLVLDRYEHRDQQRVVSRPPFANHRRAYNRTDDLGYLP